MKVRLLMFLEWKGCKEVFERFRNLLGMSEGKVEVYNPNAKEGEICLISYNNKVQANQSLFPNINNGLEHKILNQ